MARLSTAKKAAAKPAAKKAEADPSVPPATDVQAAVDEGAAKAAGPETTTKEAAKAAPGPGTAAIGVVDDPFAGFGVPLDQAAEFINGCWYGREGTGKTTDVSFMANLGPTIFINAEAGVKGRRLKKLGVNTDNIRIWPDPDKGEALTFQGLEDLFWSAQARLVDSPGSIIGFVWDSLTEIHKKLLDDIVARAVEKAAAAGKERDRFFIDRGDYGVMTEQIRLLIRRFRDLPCHFAITALERRDVDDDTGKVAYGPNITPALMDQIPGFFDILVHTTVMEIDGEEVYVGQTRPVGKYRAKDRWSATPRWMVTPNFHRVQLYVEEKLTADADPLQLEMRERMSQLREAEARAAEEKTSKKSGGSQGEQKETSAA